MRNASLNCWNDEAALFLDKIADVRAINFNFDRDDLIQTFTHNLESFTGLKVQVGRFNNLVNLLHVRLGSETLNKNPAAFIILLQTIEKNFDQCEFANKIIIIKEDNNLKLKFVLSYGQIHSYSEYLLFAADNYIAKILIPAIGDQTTLQDDKIGKSLSDYCIYANSFRKSADDANKIILDKCAPVLSQHTAFDWRYKTHQYLPGYELVPRPEDQKKFSSLEARMEIVRLLELACALFPCQYLPVIHFDKEDKNLSLPSIYFLSQITETLLIKLSKIFQFFNADKMKIIEKKIREHTLHTIYPHRDSILSGLTEQDSTGQEKKSPQPHC